MKRRCRSTLIAVRRSRALLAAFFASAAAAALASLAAGCSTQQAYGAGQAWQRQECSKINDAQERSRCMASASTSYDDYKRQADGAKAGK